MQVAKILRADLIVAGRGQINIIASGRAWRAAVKRSPFGVNRGYVRSTLDAVPALLERAVHTRGIDATRYQVSTKLCCFPFGKSPVRSISRAAVGSGVLRLLYDLLHNAGRIGNREAIVSRRLDHLSQIVRIALRSRGSHEAIDIGLPDAG